MSTHEIASRWKVSEAWVSVLCKQGRIEGAIKEGKFWKIPEEAPKPKDKRTLRKKESTAKFRFVDLFAGIGGFHQAMRYLGGECLMAAEINQECVKTYSLNFKTVEKEIRGDVKKIDPTSIAPFDVLCAGFPCQPFSKAGAQQGFNDKTRGNLFYVIMDILEKRSEMNLSTIICSQREPASWSAMILNDEVAANAILKRATRHYTVVIKPTSTD